MDRPGPAFAAGTTGALRLGSSSTNRASRFRDSGKIQVRIVEPRTLSVAKETGFLPRLRHIWDDSKV
jgi:hypothetical protein